MSITTDKPPRETLGDRVTDAMEKHDWIVWIAVSVLLLAFVKFGPYTPVKVNGTAMSPALTDGGYYVTGNIGGKLCIDDIVKTAHPDRDAQAIRMVMAVAGDRVVLGESGYRIGGIATPMSAEWLTAARAKIGDAFTVPTGQTVLRRVDPDAVDADSFEAFVQVPVEAIDGLFLRALLFTDRGFLSRVPRPGLRCLSTAKVTP